MRSNLRIGQPVADEAQDVALHWREKDVFLLRPSDDFLHLGTDIPPVSPHTLDGRDEFRDGGTFQKITMGTAVHHALDDGVFVVDRDGYQAHLRIFGQDLSTEVDATAVGHGDVEQEHVGEGLGKCLPTGLERGKRVADVGHVAAVDCLGQTFGKHRMVVDDLHIDAIF